MYVGKRPPDRDQAPRKLVNVLYRDGMMIYRMQLAGSESSSGLLYYVYMLGMRDHNMRPQLMPSQRCLRDQHDERSHDARCPGSLMACHADLKIISRIDL